MSANPVNIGRAILRAFLKQLRKISDANQKQLIWSQGRKTAVFEMCRLLKYYFASRLIMRRLVVFRKHLTQPVHPHTRRIEGIGLNTSLEKLCNFYETI